MRAHSTRDETCTFRSYASLGIARTLGNFYNLHYWCMTSVLYSACDLAILSSSMDMNGSFAEVPERCVPGAGRSSRSRGGGEDKLLEETEEERLDAVSTTTGVF